MSVIIVLDDIHDYVRFGITPPQELLSEYNQIVSQNKRAILEKRNLMIVVLHLEFVMELNNLNIVYGNKV